MLVCGEKKIIHKVNLTSFILIIHYGSNMKIVKKKQNTAKSKYL